MQELHRKARFGHGSHRDKSVPFLTNERGVIWFIELPYNYIYTWDQLRDVFLARYLSGV